ncbi:MAG: tRNA (adenosine(37)-N6)-dimethylallyltransferase MiaA [Deltaproteobacteria bacterium HGW-Deltaproteobacteria-23]|nr:MAG: tRNA (adenosine(37)-N6)-dimethylallyltransferase MiaA [Deltaproteobacteria bacterium HGW-Deltaproteobacteria-23]
MSLSKIINNFINYNVAKPRSAIVVVVGPTASGKSELAVRLAEEYRGEIVNADSMQVYRGMEIGTAKPSAELLQRAPHHLLGIVAPDVNFTAADFQQEARRVVIDIQKRNKLPIVVGGTGLYIRALLNGLAESPGSDENFRAELTALADREGSAVLLRRLQQVDPATAARLHVNDRLRIIRALEVHQQTGRPFSVYHKGFTEEWRPAVKIGIDVPRQELYRRINARVERMVAEGLVEEVQSLLAAGYHSGIKALRSIGYKEICSHLAGELSLPEAIELIKRDTRHYAKRQLTWFKREADINWLEYKEIFR